MTVSRDVGRFALKVFERLDTPRSLTASIMVRYGMWNDLVSLRVDPASYEPIFHRGIHQYRRDAQATELLRKCDGLPTGIDTARVAVDGFYACEAQNCGTNLRVSRHIDYPLLAGPVEWQADRFLIRARKWVEAVLGPLPRVLNGRFGPGATFESSNWRLRDGTCAYDKLQFSPSVSTNAAYLVDHLVWETGLKYAWGATVPSRSIPVVQGNRFATVPKDATKDRGICVEPGVNLLGQLSIGKVLRGRLLRVGIDLETGQEIHRDLARSGSLDGHLSTIDLSNASDTMCINLVRALLPPDWYALLESLRSRKTRMSTGRTEKWVCLEKFSSMGNGYTFELETLLFCALAHSVGGVVGVDTFVYGDDIIVPQSISSDVLAVLQYFGFTPNDRKTFTEGYFRESCGGDFLHGADVRPYYMKKLPSSPAEWISVANSVFALLRFIPELSAARHCALDQIPSDIRRCRGPSGLGDLVVHSCESEWTFSTRSSIRYFRVWRPVSRRKVLYHSQRCHILFFGEGFVGLRPSTRVFFLASARYHRGVHMSAALMGLPADGLIPRDSVTGFRFGRVAWS